MDAAADDDMTIISIDVVAEGVSFNDLQLSPCKSNPKLNNSMDLSEKYKILNQKYTKAYELFKTGNYQKANEILEDLYSVRYNRKEDNFRLLNLLGHTSYRLNNYPGCLKHWEEAAAYVPENKELLRNLNIVRQKLQSVLVIEQA